MCFNISTTTKHLMISLNCSSHSRGEAVDHVSISDDNEIQPAATPLPSCGHTHLVTPCLQQLSHCLHQTEGKKQPYSYYYIYYYYS